MLDGVKEKTGFLRLKKFVVVFVSKQLSVVSLNTHKTHTQRGAVT